MRTGADTQVVVGTVVEINLVADIEAQAEWTGVELHASTRIERAIGSTRTQAELFGEVTDGGGVVAHFEIHKPALHRNECADGLSAGLELGAKQSVQDADVRPKNGGAAAGGSHS